ncbi:MAG: MaoC family dehydratase [Gammaproteobacteria bacterium AqS3]|nr:MaoC family dehydratase [Gammaproteobacteria bacterium AqS3]
MSSKEKLPFPGADRAKLLLPGNQYEDFEVGQVFEHHWGRTLNGGDNALFSCLTLHFNPNYFNAEYARANGHDRILVNPLLVFNTVLGMSVEDLSERGGPFLGINELTHHRSVYEGDTLVARSTVLDKRESTSNPDVGIVTWCTEGFNQHDELVIDYRRSNIVAKRGRRARI